MDRSVYIIDQRTGERVFRRLSEVHSLDVHLASLRAHLIQTERGEFRSIKRSTEWPDETDSRGAR